MSEDSKPGNDRSPQRGGDLMTRLDAARQDLEQRVYAAEVVNDPVMALLRPLAEVADYLCRIGDHSESAHYTAEKSRPLVEAALSVRRAAIGRYCSDEPERRLHDVTRLAEDCENAVANLMWGIAYDRPVYQSTADQARQALAALTAWVNEQTLNPVPDE